MHLTDEEARAAIRDETRATIREEVPRALAREREAIQHATRDLFLTKEYLTLKEVGRYIGGHAPLSERAVRYLTDGTDSRGRPLPAGPLPYSEVMGKRVVSRADLVAWLGRQGRKGTAGAEV